MLLKKMKAMFIRYFYLYFLRFQCADWLHASDDMIYSNGSLIITWVACCSLLTDVFISLPVKKIFEKVNKPVPFSSVLACQVAEQLEGQISGVTT